MEAAKYSRVVDPFVSGLNLRPALQRTAVEGAAHVPGTLDPAFLRALHRGVEERAFEPAPVAVGPVRQETETTEAAPGAIPQAELLRDAFAAMARSHGRGIRGLATWRPNEVVIQRYRPGALGITPHLDGKRFRRLVAVFTTSGSARFAVCRDRAGEVVAEWEAGPGSLVLLRGPGLSGHRDGRPFHLVDGPRRGWRYSVGLRMDARR